MRAIENRCSHFKSSMDGSYGLALNNAGYHELKAELLTLGYKYQAGEAVKIET